MKRCLILDFDDTLVYTMGVHVYAWARALSIVTKLDIKEDSIALDLNYGSDVLFKKYKLSSDEIEKAKELKRNVFKTYLHKTTINDLIMWLAKSNLFEKVIIASNSSRDNINKIFDYHSIDENIFDLIVCRDDVENKKPHTDMFDLIKNTYPEYSSDDYVMIGDSEVDQLFAIKNDIKCIILNH